MAISASQEVDDLRRDLNAVSRPGRVEATLDGHIRRAAAGVAGLVDAQTRDIANRVRQHPLTMALAALLAGYAFGRVGRWL